MNRFSIQYEFQHKTFDAQVELIPVGRDETFYRVTTAGVVLDIVPEVHPETAEICWKERAGDVDEPREAIISDLVQAIGDAIYQFAM